MAPKALIIGATGQVGRSTTVALQSEGWEVEVMHRSSGNTGLDTRTHIVDRNDLESIEKVLQTGYDAVIDLVAFDTNHVHPLLKHSKDIGSLVVLSSAAVYKDQQGRALQTAVDLDSSPVFDAPITEDNPVVSALEDSYAGRKRAMEIALLSSSESRVTIIRPGGIHGPYSSQPREWFYVKRILDGRRIFLHGFGGRSSLHPTSVDNLSEMIRLAASNPGSRILNSGDPGLPDERYMAAAIASAMDKSDLVQVLLPGVPAIASPWSLPSPFFLSTEAAERELDYKPVTTYAQTAVAIVQWIHEELASGEFQQRLDKAFGVPGLGSQVFVGHGGAPFDYQVEDTILEQVRGSRHVENVQQP